MTTQSGAPDSLPSDNWIFNQSAVIPYRYHNEKLEVLLITSRRKKHWVVPKGIIEPGLSPVTSALKEAFEEAGIQGEVPVEKPLGTYEYQKWGGTCQVRVYLMKVTREVNNWPEASFRDRCWVSIPEALNKVDQTGLQKLLQTVPQITSKY